MTCRQMNIGILPPDINKGEADFSVDGGNIRYGLAAIKSVGTTCDCRRSWRNGKPAGRIKDLEDFITRLSAEGSS